MSRVAGRPQIQLGRRMSAGQEREPGTRLGKVSPIRELGQPTWLH